MTGYDRLSALDSSFLHLESRATPMHVGSLAIFEGEQFFDGSGRFRLAAVRDLVTSRLHHIPRFRRRLMAVPMEQGRPIWVDDDRFDISYHVRLTALPQPGSWDQLRALTARIQMHVLDRSRPLWELWFVEGLESGRVGLVQKTHHALVDGVSGVDVATVLLDFHQHAETEAAPPWSPAPVPSSARLLADTMRERATEPSELVRTARGLARTPQRVASRASDVGRAVRSVLEFSPLAPATSFNRPVSASREFVGVTIDLVDVQRVRSQLGGTINDVVLAGVAGALRRRFVARDEVLPEAVRVLCPVSVRGDHETMQLGNRVSAMFVELPIAEPDPSVRLQMIGEVTRDLKEREQSLGASFLLGLTEYAAPTLLALAARLVHRQPFVNFVVTNIPGPQVPLYCLGARMIEAYPMVPLSQNLGLGIAILSYCGVLHIGLMADAIANPDLADFGADLTAAFAELGHAALDIAAERETTG